MEISNEKLASLNDISERNFQDMSLEFRQQTQMLVAMKKQLDSCFRRIRSLKSKLASQYPEAYRGRYDIITCIVNACSGTCRGCLSL